MPGLSCEYSGFHEHKKILWIHKQKILDLRADGEYSMIMSVREYCKLLYFLILEISK